MDFSDIASVSGKGGLFKVINPTRTGVILEAMDGSGKKLVAGMQTKVSVLSDISIYTTNEEGAVPLETVLKTIHQEFKGDTGLEKDADGEELKAFLKHVLPEYDEDRVYVSDIKKLIKWYGLLAEQFPEMLQDENKEEASAETEPNEEGEAQ
jgi:hypothetical protein